MVLLFNTLFVSRHKGMLFFKYHMFTAIIFGIIYWISDYIIGNYPIFSKKFMLGNYETKKSANPLYYWIWHSLVTQTTVGYHGLSGSDGKIIPLLEQESNLYTIFNFMQLISIFYITALFI